MVDWLAILAMILQQTINGGYTVLAASVLSAPEAHVDFTVKIGATNYTCNKPGQQINLDLEPFSGSTFTCPDPNKHKKIG
jgi:hypothetical protein